MDKKITPSQFNTEYGHLTVNSVQRDIDDVKDLFKILKIDSQPVPSYSHNLDCLAFPYIFPYGFGGRGAPRKYLTAATYEKTHIMTSDSFRRRNKQYLFFMAQQRESRVIKQGLFCVINSKRNQGLTKANIQKSAENEDPQLLRRVSNILRKLPSQNEYWYDVKIKLQNMVHEYGPPTFWATFSPGDYEDEELHKHLY